MRDLVCRTLKLSCFSLASLTCNSYAGTEGNLHIKIDNQLEFEYLDARIMIDDKWFDLGDIATGENRYNIPAGSGSNAGLIQAKNDNNDWVGIVAKKNKRNEISISLANGEFVKNGETIVAPRSLAQDSDGKSFSVNEIVSFGPEKYDYGWYTKCGGGGAAGAALWCHIDAEASDYRYLTFLGWGGGVGGLYSEGVWTSKYSKNELRGREGVFNSWGAFYTSITMKEPSPTGGNAIEHSWFKGGGFSIFTIGGNAKINPQ